MKVDDGFGGITILTIQVRVTVNNPPVLVSGYKKPSQTSVYVNTAKLCLD